MAVSMEFPMHSPEWVAARAAAFRGRAVSIVETLEKYEYEHPPHDEGVPCLERALVLAKKALEDVQRESEE